MSEGEKENPRSGLTTFRRMLSKLTCFCPRCNTRLKLSPLHKPLRELFLQELLSGRRFTVPGWLTIKLETYGGHWLPTTTIPYWPWVRHSPSWSAGYVRLEMRTNQRMRKILRRIRKKSEPQGQPPAEWVRTSPKKKS